MPLACTKRGVIYGIPFHCPARTQGRGATNLPNSSRVGLLINARQLIYNLDWIHCKIVFKLPIYSCTKMCARFLFSYNSNNPYVLSSGGIDGTDVL